MVTLNPKTLNLLTLTCAGTVSSERYHLLPGDLREPEALASALHAAGLDAAAPTFVLAECARRPPMGSTCFPPSLLLPGARILRALACLSLLSVCEPLTKSLLCGMSRRAELHLQPMSGETV